MASCQKSEVPDRIDVSVQTSLLGRPGRIFCLSNTSVDNLQEIIFGTNCFVLFTVRAHNCPREKVVTNFWTTPKIGYSRLGWF